MTTTVSETPFVFNRAHTLNSSFIDAAYYNDDTCTLGLTFQDNPHVYTYEVPPEEFEEFVAVDSPGSFYSYGLDRSKPGERYASLSYAPSLSEQYAKATEDSYYGESVSLGQALSDNNLFAVLIGFKYVVNDEQRALISEAVQTALSDLMPYFTPQVLELDMELTLNV